MHETFEKIRAELSELAETVEDSISDDEPLNIRSANWSFPGISRSEIHNRVMATVELIDTFAGDSIKVNPKILADYPRRIEFIRDNCLPNLEGSSGTAYSVIEDTLRALEVLLQSNFDRDPNAEAIRRLKALTKKLEAREAQIDQLSPKLDEIEKMVTAIESAYNAADQLPTDLKLLSDARAQINQLKTDVEADKREISAFKEEISSINEHASDAAEKATNVLARCETAYSAATSVGLAAAFTERSKSLGNSVWIWTAGLLAALATGGYLGILRIEELAAALQTTGTPDSALFIRFMLSLLSVGAPVWFAWLATRQIGQRFRLSEDYAFKASVSRAYEGYRREAARIDPDLEAQLLSSALNRLDEQPLRLVETESHSSPMSELVNSKVVERAFNTIPDFADRVREFARQSLESGAALLPARTNHEAQEKRADSPIAGEGD